MINTFDFDSLRSSEHMLRWLADDPFGTLRKEFETILNQQVPGSTLLGLRAQSEPSWLTGAIPNKGDASKGTLVRTGVAFEFALSVRTPDGATHDLAGVFTWVGVNLHDRARTKQRTWFDLNGTLAQYGAHGELKTRMFFA